MSDDGVPMVVFDTGVQVQAVLNPNGPSAACMEFVDRGDVVVYTSPRLRHELEDVLYRPSVRAKNALVTEELVESVLSWYDGATVMVPNPPAYIQFPRDHDDEHVTNLAIRVEADYLVTRDKDLLDLADSHTIDGRFFKRHFHTIAVVDPVQFLIQMRTRLADKG